MEFKADSLKDAQSGWSLLSHGCRERLGKRGVHWERALQEGGESNYLHEARAGQTDKPHLSYLPPKPEEMWKHPFLAPSRARRSLSSTLASLFSPYQPRNPSAGWEGMVPAPQEPAPQQYLCFPSSQFVEGTKTQSQGSDLGVGSGSLPGWPHYESSEALATRGG